MTSNKESDVLQQLMDRGLIPSIPENQKKRLFDLADRGSRTSTFVEEYCRPNLIRRDLNLYLPIHYKKESRFKPKTSVDYQTNLDGFEQNPEHMHREMAPPSLFCNMIKVFDSSVDQQQYSQDLPITAHPKYHAAPAPFWVFTFELDDGDPRALEQQLCWVWPEDAKSEPGINRLVTLMKRQFKDFRGALLVWSGNKSVHIHLVFDSTHLDSALMRAVAKSNGKNPEAALRDHWKKEDINPGKVRDYYKKKWAELSDVVAEVLGVSNEFDENLRFYEQKRRYPNGYREIEIPDTEEVVNVRQLVLYESFQKRSAKGAAGYFLSAIEANALKTIPNSHHDDPPEPSRKRKNESDQSQIPDGWQSVFQFVVDDLCKYIFERTGKEYPKPAWFVLSDKVLGLKFYNGPNDRIPSSYVGLTYSKIIINGKRDGLSEEIHCLPGNVSLRDILESFKSEYQAKGDTEKVSILDKLLDPATLGQADVETSTKEQPRWAGQSFVTDSLMKGHTRGDSQRIRSRLRVAITRTMMTSKQAMIISIEGAGKSSALMDQVFSRREEWEPQTYYEYDGDEKLLRYHPAKEGLFVVACGSYAQAEEQMQSYLERNKLKSDSVHCMLLNSFEQRYQRHMDAAGRKDILRSTDYLDQGFSTLVDAVAHTQPDVYAEITKAKNLSWGNAQGANEVIVFTTHKMAQEFGKISKSQAWLHPEFSLDMEPVTWTKLCDSLHVLALVHDEVSISDLLEIVPHDAWCAANALALAIKREHKRDWADVAVSKAYSTYLKRKYRHSFFDLKNIHDLHLGSGDIVVVDHSRLPFGADSDDSGIYSATTGGKFLLAKKQWWKTAAERVYISTTERLPAEIFRKFLIEAAPERPATLVELDSPDLLEIEYLPVYLANLASSTKVGELAGDLLTNGLGNGTSVDIVIADGARKYFEDSQMPVPDGIHTHRGARGRNGLADKDIVTVLTYMSPEQYAELNCIAQYLGLDDVLYLFYVDRLNQAVGRNRGMRNAVHLMPPSAERGHALFMTPRLHRQLREIGVFDRGRYRGYLVNSDRDKAA